MLYKDHLSLDHFALLLYTVADMAYLTILNTPTPSAITGSISNGNKRDLSNHYMLWQAWAKPDTYMRACEWLGANFKKEEACFDVNAGFSYINGTIYPTYVIFKKEEDFLVFKIKFRELCI
jgi:hypothetical protein